MKSTAVRSPCLILVWVLAGNLGPSGDTHAQVWHKSAICQGLYKRIHPQPDDVSKRTRASELGTEGMQVNIWGPDGGRQWQYSAPVFVGERSRTEPVFYSEDIFFSLTLFSTFGVTLMTILPYCPFHVPIKFHTDEPQPGKKTKTLSV